MVAAAAVVLIGLAAGPWGVSAGIRRSLRGADLPEHLLLSGVIVATYIAGLALCALSLGTPPGAAVLTVFPLLLMAMALPVSVGGWGLREAAATVMLPLLGWSAGASLAVAALYGLSALLGALPGALVLLRPGPA